MHFTPLRQLFIFRNSWRGWGLLTQTRDFNKDGCWLIPTNVMVFLVGFRRSRGDKHKVYISACWRWTLEAEQSSYRPTRAVYTTISTSAPVVGLCHQDGDGGRPRGSTYWERQERRKEVVRDINPPNLDSRTFLMTKKSCSFVFL